MKENKLMTTKNVVLMGMFGALAGVLMVFEIPLPFLAPSFYGLDIIEIVKILVKLVLKPTSTGFVGELANLTFGCAMVIPAGLIYQFKKTRKGAMAALTAGTLLMSVTAIVGNALVMLPFYSNFMPLENIIAAGAAINPAVSNVWTFAFICVGPFNVIKGIVVSVITTLVYKHISAMIHSIGTERGNRQSRKLRA